MRRHTGVPLTIALALGAGHAFGAEPGEDTGEPATRTYAEPPPLHEDGERAPAPPPPRADSQEPRPFLEAPRAGSRERRLDFGPDFGLALRPAEGDAASYAPGVAWGLHARIEGTPWLALRLSFANCRHGVTVTRGALRLPGSTLEQSSLQATLLTARLEPTWVLTPEVRLFAGVGAGWARVVAERASSTGALRVETSERAGVGLEFSGALGAIIDVVPDWLAATLALSGATVTNQSGSLFSDSAGFDSRGKSLTVGGLPKFSASYSALLGLGVVL